MPGREPSLGGTVGANVLTVNNANSYYETSDSCQKCESKGFILDVTPEEEAAMKAYFQNLIKGSQRHPKRSNWYILPNDYAFIGNNCASTVVDALKEGLPWYHQMSLPVTPLATPQTLELNLELSPFLVESEVEYQKP